MPTLDSVLTGGNVPTADIEEQANHAASPTHFTSAVTSKDVVFFLGALFAGIYLLHILHRAVKSRE